MDRLIDGRAIGSWAIDRVEDEYPNAAVDVETR
jgi:hypothetical protein